jgi:iron-sulfur-dependent L-serine dehydratase beta subunit
MTVSIFDIFKIGIGPSSSHTMGPMLAARRFLVDAVEAGVFDRIERVGAQLYGSLALTGRGHCTDRAILLGLEGETPEVLDPRTTDERLARIRQGGRLRLLGTQEVAFDDGLDLLFHTDQSLPRHPNGMRFTALDGAGEVLLREEFYSLGGGFIARGDEEAAAGVEELQVQFPARQRGCLAAVVGHPGAAPGDLAGDEGMRAPGVRHRRGAAGRAQGAPPGAAPVQGAVRGGRGRRFHGLGERLRPGRE